MIASLIRWLLTLLTSDCLPHQVAVYPCSQRAFLAERLLQAVQDGARERLRRCAYPALGR